MNPQMTLETLWETSKTKPKEAEAGEAVVAAVEAAKVLASGAKTKVGMVDTVVARACVAVVANNSRCKLKLTKQSISLF